MEPTYEPEITLDRDSQVPLYQQIAKPIETAILSGALPAGAMIEDEVSMASRLDVARPTARRALQELASRGLLTRRRGVGTRVTPPHVHRPMKLSSLNDDLAEAGFSPTTRVLSYEVREASPEEAEKLSIPRGEGLLAVRRLRYADDHPLALMTNLIPLDIAPTWQGEREGGRGPGRGGGGATADDGAHRLRLRRAGGRVRPARLPPEPVLLPLLTVHVLRPRRATGATGPLGATRLTISPRMRRNRSHP